MWHVGDEDKVVCKWSELPVFRTACWAPMSTLHAVTGAVCSPSAFKTRLKKALDALADNDVPVEKRVRAYEMDKVAVKVQLTRSNLQPGEILVHGPHYCPIIADQVWICAFVAKRPELVLTDWTVLGLQLKSDTQR